MYDQAFSKRRTLSVPDLLVLIENILAVDAALLFSEMHLPTTQETFAQKLFVRLK